MRLSVDIVAILNVDRRWQHQRLWRLEIRFGLGVVGWRNVNVGPADKLATLANVMKLRIDNRRMNGGSPGDVAGAA